MSLHLQASLYILSFHLLHWIPAWQCTGTPEQRPPWWNLISPTRWKTSRWKVIDHFKERPLWWNLTDRFDDRPTLSLDISLSIPHHILQPFLLIFVGVPKEDLPCFQIRSTQAAASLISWDKAPDWDWPKIKELTAGLLMQPSKQNRTKACIKLSGLYSPTRCKRLLSKAAGADGVAVRKNNKGLIFLTLEWLCELRLLCLSVSCLSHMHKHTCTHTHMHVQHTHTHTHNIRMNLEGLQWHPKQATDVTFTFSSFPHGPDGWQCRYGVPSWKACLPCVQLFFAACSASSPVHEFVGRAPPPRQSAWHLKMIRKKK